MAHAIVTMATYYNHYYKAHTCYGNQWLATECLVMARKGHQAVLGRNRRERKLQPDQRWTLINGDMRSGGRWESNMFWQWQERRLTDEGKHWFITLPQTTINISRPVQLCTECAVFDAAVVHPPDVSPADEIDINKDLILFLRASFTFVINASAQWVPISTPKLQQTTRSHLNTIVFRCPFESLTLSEI